jgi:threonine efflux protein
MDMTSNIGHKKTIDRAAPIVDNVEQILCKTSILGLLMIDSTAVATVFLVYAAGVVIPGPNFVAVAHKAVSGSRSDTFALVAGIVTVNLFWATCAILGIGVVFATLPWLAVCVRLVGAGYLVWFGIRLMTNARASDTTTPHPPNQKASQLRAAFLQGFATNIANPKSIAFYAAVFSSATPAHVSVQTFFAMLVTVGATATCWYGAVALVLSHSSIAARYRRSRIWIDRACGCVIVALGVRQALR